MAGNWFATLIHTSFPGSVLSLFIVFLLLQTGVLRLKWLETGANWLLSELLLLFIPSAVGIVLYKHLMEIDGWKIILIIGISTILVMSATGSLTQVLLKYRNHKQKELSA